MKQLSNYENVPDSRLIEKVRMQMTDSPDRAGRRAKTADEEKLM